MKLYTRVTWRYRKGRRSWQLCEAKVSLVGDEKLSVYVRWLPSVRTLVGSCTTSSITKQGSGTFCEDRMVSQYMHDRISMTKDR
jgi:hypothetical protein